MFVVRVLKGSAVIVAIVEIAVGPGVVYGQVGATNGVHTATPHKVDTVEDTGSRGEALGEKLVLYGNLNVVGNRSVYLVTASDRIQLVGPIVPSLLRERRPTWKIEGRLVDANTVHAVKAIPLKR